MKIVAKIIVIVAILATEMTLAQTSWTVTDALNLNNPTLHSSLPTNDNILGTGTSGYELNCVKTNPASMGYVTFSKSFSSITARSLSVWFRNNNDLTTWHVSVYSGNNTTASAASADYELSLTGDNVKITFDFGSNQIFDKIEFYAKYKSNSGTSRTVWFNNITTDGNVVIDSYGPTPLPVELNSFTGKTTAKGIALNWTTATEVNNYGFDVERKSAGNDWEKIAFISGNGNSNSPKSYSYIDSYAELKSKVNFYRLKQIDSDGKFSYSQEISIKAEMAPNSLKLNSYPNPFNPATTINFVLPENGRVNLSVYNSLGQKVSEIFNGNLEAGVNEVRFDGSNLPSGAYFIRLVTPTGQTAKKVLLLK